MVVDVLDPVTLQRLQALKFPQDISARHEALIFSPDSRILTYCGNGVLDSFGLNLFTISWDLQTGGIVSDIRREVPKGSPVRNPSIAYSTNGKIVGVLDWGFTAHAILFFDVASGIHTHSLSPNGNDPSPNDNTWTFGDSLRFVTADVTTITIWEVGFTSGATPTEVKTFPAPDGFDDREGVRLHQTRPRFSPDGHDIWCTDRSGRMEVLRVGDELGMLERPKRAVDIEHPPEGYPWRSSHGYWVTNDW